MQGESIMSIKQKIKSVWNKVKCKTDDKSKNDKSDCDGDSCKINSELAAEEVIQEEVFPAKKHAAKKTCKRCGCTRKPASTRTRPTNPDYKMIDPDDDTCDSSKS